MADASVPVRVLIVDDSEYARFQLRAVFSSDPRFIVVGEASDGRGAVTAAEELSPGLISMDIDMPGMDGLAAIGEIMGRTPTPIMVVTGHGDADTAFRAVSRGAVEVVLKDEAALEDPAGFLDKAALVASIPVLRHLLGSRRAPVAGSDASSCATVVTIASSTGGPRALATVLSSLPATTPCPILVAQHLAAGFGPAFTTWLDGLCELTVQLGRRGDVVRPGTVYIAPPEMHMGVSRNGSIVLTEPAKEDLYRPSCDVLLRTAAAAWGPNLVGVILTGMGHDGVAGLAAVRAAGGRTVAQDEATSVVHGMNRRAVEKGLVDQVLPIQDLGATIINLCRSPGTAVPAYCPPRPGRGTVS